MDSPSILVATLGGQPQVVTFALDALLAQGERIGEVAVVHHAPSSGRLHQSLMRLAAEFPGDRYRGQPCHLRPIVIAAPRGRITDIRDAHDADAAWLTLHELLGTLKAQDRCIHLCLAGGRRLLGLLALSVAMLYFGHQDRIWHLYTPDELRRRADEGAVMHAQPDDGVRLIPVPIAPWGAYFPAIRTLLASSPAQVLVAQRRQMDVLERALCEQVLSKLTEREREVLRAFANGSQPQEVTAQLNITPKTVDTHKTKILAECRVAWNMPESSWLDYHFLHDKFGRYFDSV